MIKLVVFDFDGVFTDGTVFFSENGAIVKGYNVKDGYGITLLRESGITVGTISGYADNKSQQSIIQRLKIKYCYIGIENKLDVLKKWCGELKVDLSEVAYMGDDLNDIEIMGAVGYSGCPNDAVNECKEICNYISNYRGGHGCIRDFCNNILKNNQY